MWVRRGCVVCGEYGGERVGGGRREERVSVCGRRPSSPFQKVRGQGTRLT